MHFALTEVRLSKYPATGMHLGAYLAMVLKSISALHCVHAPDFSHKKQSYGQLTQFRVEFSIKYLGGHPVAHPFDGVKK